MLEIISNRMWRNFRSHPTFSTTPQINSRKHSLEHGAFHALQPFSMCGGFSVYPLIALIESKSSESSLILWKIVLFKILVWSWALRFSKASFVTRNHNTLVSCGYSEQRRMSAVMEKESFASDKRATWSHRRNRKLTFHRSTRNQFCVVARRKQRLRQEAFIVVKRPWTCWNRNRWDWFRRTRPLVVAWRSHPSWRWNLIQFPFSSCR